MKLGDYLISTKSTNIHDRMPNYLKSIHHFLEPELWGDGQDEIIPASDVWSLGQFIYNHLENLNVLVSFRILCQARNVFDDKNISI